MSWDIIGTKERNRSTAQSKTTKLLHRRRAVDNKERTACGMIQPTDEPISKRTNKPPKRTNSAPTADQPTNQPTNNNRRTKRTKV